MLDCEIQKNPLFPPPHGRSPKIPRGREDFKSPRGSGVGGGGGRRKVGVPTNKCENVRSINIFWNNVHCMAKTG